jgi:ribosomal protein S8
MFHKISKLIDDVAESLEAKGYVEEAEELDAISNVLDKSSSVIKWEKGYAKGMVKSGDDVYVTKEDPELGTEVGDKLQIQRVNSDGTYYVKKRPFRDNPEPFTISRDSISSRNPKPWYSKRSSLDRVDTGKGLALEAGIDSSFWESLGEAKQLRLREWLMEPYPGNRTNADALKKYLDPYDWAVDIAKYERVKSEREGVLKKVQEEIQESYDKDFQHKLFTMQTEYTSWEGKLLGKIEDHEKFFKSFLKSIKGMPQLVEYIKSENEKKIESYSNDKSVYYQAFNDLRVPTKIMHYDQLRKQEKDSEEFHKKEDFLSQLRKDQKRIHKKFKKEGSEHMDKIASMIDKVADSLEYKGYSKEASELDAISNLMDKMASGPGADLANKAGVDPSVWANLVPAEQVELTKWLQAMDLKSGTANFAILKRYIDKSSEDRKADLKYLEDKSDGVGQVLPLIEWLKSLK